MTQARDDTRRDREVLYTVGTVLAGRYRLVRPVSSGAHSTLWRAADEVLARPVAIRVLDRAIDLRQRERFRKAGGLAGRICHPRVAGVYDAGVQDDLDYLVGEWVEGAPLAALFRDGPLSSTSATALVYQVAEGLAAAAAAGLCHGRLHPGNVLVSSGLRVKLTDLAVGAATVGPVPGLPEPSPVGDVAALGALLYAALTSRWPVGAAFGLPAAPVRDGAVCAPRQVRAGVSNSLDLLAMRMLNPLGRSAPAALTSAGEVLAVVGPLLGSGRSEPPTTLATASRRPEAGQRSRRLLTRAGLGLALMASVAGGGWFAGYQIGQLPGSGVHPPSAAAPQRSGVPASSPQPLLPTTVSDFDPPPGDGQEQTTFVSAAYDGDLSTAWVTDRYRASPDFGGLKPGVGLLVDFGRPTAVGRATLTLTSPGATVELRAMTQPGRPDTLVGSSVVDQVAGCPLALTLTARSASPPPTRYWLVWFTSLPADPGGGFREGIAEMAFFAPA